MTWKPLLVRYHVPTGYLYTTLLYYGDRPPPQLLKDWFSGYNARQTIEAGIKEGKGVFRMRHPWVRSPIGMQLQEQFSLFAANFVRWAAQWAQQLVRQANHALNDALTKVKTLVHDVAHCRARLIHNLVVHSPWPMTFPPSPPLSRLGLFGDFAGTMPSSDCLCSYIIGVCP